MSNTPLMGIEALFKEMCDYRDELLDIEKFHADKREYVEAEKARQMSWGITTAMMRVREGIK